jgi:hypothetical protein
MPCYRCGARQSDPVRGPSPWKRGVRAASQVLVCPACQRGRDWTADLDSCPSCGSTMLSRTLGETTCRGCGAAGFVAVPADTAADAAGTSPERAALAAEVASAIARVLGRAGEGPQ